jgi:subtilase family serine protease
MLAAVSAVLVPIAVSGSAQADGVHAAVVRNRSIAAGNRAPIAEEASAVLPKLAGAGRGYVRDGLAPALPAGATLVGPVPSSEPLEVDLALVPNNPVALAEFATDVATPGSSDYRHYITTPEFADTFGANPSEIRAVRAAMSAAGLKSQAPTANRLEITVTGTAREFERAFATTLDRYRLTGGRLAIANTLPPRIASSAAKYVSSVVGLNTLVQLQPLETKPLVSTGTGVLSPSTLVSAASPATAAITPTTQTAATASSYANGPTPCKAAVSFAASDSSTVIAGTPISSDPGITDDTYNYNVFSKAYDFNALYREGHLGQGVNVGIFELEPNFPSDPTAFDKCYGIDTPVHYVSVDGAEPAPDASDQDGLESALDIETISALAPDSNITVYQGNEDADTGWLDTFNRIVSDDHDRVVSVSYGACEQLESELVGSQPQAEVTIFEEAATQGQTFSVSSGDSGAEGCRLDTDTMVAAVDDPAADPFVTGVGGTSLEAAGDPPTTRPTEVVWNNGPALDAADEGGAGGGGLSTLWLMPSYQTGAAASLGVINSESQGLTDTAGAICSGAADDSNPPVIESPAYYCREVPDVTASADPYYGFTVYYDGAWTSVGGTSGAAPIWSALFADADSAPSCHARPIGFANPALYKLASSRRYSSDFNDITSGSNDEGVSNGTYFNAKTGYDMASGLGSPVAANLASDLCSTSSK